MHPHQHRRTTSHQAVSTGWRSTDYRHHWGVELFILDSSLYGHKLGNLLHTKVPLPLASTRSDQTSSTAASSSTTMNHPGSHSVLFDARSAEREAPTSRSTSLAVYTPCSTSLAIHCRVRVCDSENSLFPL